MGKGEIARNEQFLLFPKCFQKTCNADTKKTGLVWERVKSSSQTAFHGVSLEVKVSTQKKRQILIGWLYWGLTSL